VHTIHRLYSKEFDFEEGTVPVRSVLLATTPRAGSTVFAEQMWKTGAMGAPMEYPSIRNRRELFQRLRSESWSDYWDKVRHRRTSPNGVFSYKMFPCNLLEIARKEPALYKKISSTHIIFLTRQDQLSQAISLVKASQTGAWFCDTDHKHSLIYDAELISTCLASIRKQLGFWEDFFLATGARVHRVTYEQLLENRGSVLSKIAAHIEVELTPDRTISIPMIRMQRDALSEEWRLRFLEERNELSDLREQTRRNAADVSTRDLP
jgi:LPS sulfotransferase NodH